MKTISKRQTPGKVFHLVILSSLVAPNFHHHVSRLIPIDLVLSIGDMCQIFSDVCAQKRKKVPFSKYFHKSAGE